MGDTGSREGGEPASMNETGPRPLGSNVELGMVLRSRVMEGLEVEGGQEGMGVRVSEDEG